MARQDKDEETMEYATLAVDRYDAVCRISLARESARNAQSQQMLDELDDALTRAEQDDSVRVVVLAGRGAHFSAGHDLKEAQAKRADFTVEERWEYESRRYYGYCMRIWDFPNYCSAGNSIAPQRKLHSSARACATTWQKVIWC